MSRGASPPKTQTKLWQWIAAGSFLTPVILIPILINFVPETLQSDNTSRIPNLPAKANSSGFEFPGDRVILGGGIRPMAILAALFIPNWTLRPPLIGWTSPIPGRNPVWFVVRVSARYRSAFSLTTVMPFIIAVAIIGVLHIVVDAGRVAGSMNDGVNGLPAIMVPIFLVVDVEGVVNVAMVGRTRHQGGALLGAIGARSSATLGSTALKGAIYAITGVLFGPAMILLSTISAVLVSGDGTEVFIGSTPATALSLTTGASPVLVITAMWLPVQFSHRLVTENLRQPV